MKGLWQVLVAIIAVGVSTSAAQPASASEDTTLSRVAEISKKGTSATDADTKLLMGYLRRGPTNRVRRESSLVLRRILRQDVTDALVEVAVDTSAKRESRKYAMVALKGHARLLRDSEIEMILRSDEDAAEVFVPTLVDLAPHAALSLEQIRAILARYDKGDKRSQNTRNVGIVVFVKEYLRSRHDDEDAESGPILEEFLMDKALTADPRSGNLRPFIAQAMVENDIPGAVEVCIQCLKDSFMRKRVMRMPLGSLFLLQLLSTATGQKRGLDQKTMKFGDPRLEQIALAWLEWWEANKTNPKYCLPEGKTFESQAPAQAQLNAVVQPNKPGTARAGRDFSSKEVSWRSLVRDLRAGPTTEARAQSAQALEKMPAKAIADTLVALAADRTAHPLARRYAMRALKGQVEFLGDAEIEILLGAVDKATAGLDLVLQIAARMNLSAEKIGLILSHHVETGSANVNIQFVRFAGDYLRDHATESSEAEACRLLEPFLLDRARTVGPPHTSSPLYAFYIANAMSENRISGAVEVAMQGLRAAQERREDADLAFYARMLLRLLTKLTGETMGFDRRAKSPDDAVLRKASQKWFDWWKSNKGNPTYRLPLPMAPDKKDVRR